MPVITDYGNAQWVDKRRIYTDTSNMVVYQSTIWADEALIEGALVAHNAQMFTAPVLACMNLNDKRYALRCCKNVADMEPAIATGT